MLRDIQATDPRVSTPALFEEDDDEVPLLVLVELLELVEVEERREVARTPPWIVAGAVVAETFLAASVYAASVLFPVAAWLMTPVIPDSQCLPVAQ